MLNYDAKVALLSPDEVAKLQSRFEARVDFLISLLPVKQVVVGKEKLPVGKAPSNRGRPAKSLENPFAFHIGPVSGFGRYPFFAQDIVEGIARLDWHGRGESKGSSKPLSVRKLMIILETLPCVSTAAISELFVMCTRQAQRYLKAIEIALPFLLRSCPPRLRSDIEGCEGSCDWVWDDEQVSPPMEDLIKLNCDLGSPL